MGLMIDIQPAVGRALVIGGGAVATQKVRSLVEAGFEATVVAPEIAAAIRDQPGVQLRERVFFPADIDGHGLVFACTDSREVNRAAGELARATGIPVDVVDRREESTFFSVALLREGPLAIGVSTGGTDPAKAKAVRDKIRALLASGLGGGRE